MKNKYQSVIKSAVTVAVLVLAFMGGSGVVLASTGYITWGGSDDFDAVLDNLNLLSGELGNLDESLASVQSEKEKLQVLLTEAEEAGVEKDAELTRLKNEKDTEITRLQNEKKDLNSQLIAIETSLEVTLANVDDIKGKGARHDGLVGGLNEISAIIYGSDSSHDFGRGVSGPQKSDELRQAEIDMSAIRQETETLLESRNK